MKIIQWLGVNGHFASQHICEAFRRKVPRQYGLLSLILNNTDGIGYNIGYFRSIGDRSSPENNIITFSTQDSSFVQSTKIVN
ncbi:hypothetical protein VV11_003010 [Trichodesmium erythraeum 21-75]|nr:hypothetical protein [Trichodesmium erythraeum 21-75]